MNEKRIVLIDRIRLMYAIEELRKTTDSKEVYECIIRPYKSKRSLDANNYWWSQIVTPLADHLGYTPDEMHEVLLGEIYGWTEVKFREKTYQVPRERSSNKNVDEFSKLIEHGQRICAEHGVNVTPPMEEP